jgi:two-component system, cell cycle sensor histidine kinase and response regulator CckA
MCSENEKSFLTTEASLLIQNFREPVTALSREGIILDGNPAFWKLLSAEKETILGQPLKNCPVFVHPDDASCIMELLRQENVNKEIILPLRLKNGLLNHFRLTIVYFDQVQPPHFVLWLHHYENEWQNNQTAKQLSAFIENDNDAVVIFDLNGTPTFINSTFEKLWKLHRSEILHQQANFLEKAGLALETFYQMIVNMESLETELQYENENGNTIFLARFFPLYDKDGKFINYAAYFQDITTQKKLQTDIQHLRKLEALGNLTGGIAHDFNNLLTVINGQAEISGYRLSEDHPVKENLAYILDAGQRAAKMTSKLLAFSRKRVPQRNPLSINYLLLELKKILNRLIGENIELQYNLDDKTPFILADESEIEQIILNLVVNARDALNDESNQNPTPKIKLATGNYYFTDDNKPIERLGSGEYACFQIEDNGTGIPKNLIEKIFNPFFTTKGEGKGTGLGLATVYDIVLQNDGYIKVDSTQGKGTLFTIYIPATFAVTADKNFGNQQYSQKGEETLVLLVEDDFAVRTFLKTALSDNGYIIAEAVNGQDAIQWLSQTQQKPAVIVSDVIMPVKNGTELVQFVHKNYPKIKVLFTSGYSVELVQNFLKPRHTDFLSKPYSINQVMTKIADLLAQK